MEVIHGFAVDDGPRAGGVVSDHASNAGAAGAGRVRRKKQSVGAKLLVQLIQHHARLHADAPFLGTHPNHPVHVFGKIEDDGTADGLSRQAGGRLSVAKPALDAAGRLRAPL